ncbi:MAG: ATP synthase F1 subunit delta [Thermodesulfobacteriota bacterium]
MAISTIAKRYARALLEIGVEEKAHAKFGTELRDIYAVSTGNPELTGALSNRMFKLEERRALADGVLDMLGATDMVKRFIRILIDNGKIGQLEDVCSAYFDLEDELSGRIRVDVETPGAAPQGFITDLKARLKEETGKEIIVNHGENPEIVGGFVIRVGNVLLDASLKVQLEHMKEKIVEGVV